MPSLLVTIHHSHSVAYLAALKRVNAEHRCSRSHWALGTDLEMARPDAHRWGRCSSDLCIHSGGSCSQTPSGNSFYLGGVKRWQEFHRVVRVRQEVVMQCW